MKQKTHILKQSNVGSGNPPKRSRRPSPLVWLLNIAWYANRAIFRVIEWPFRIDLGFQFFRFLWFVHQNDYAAGRTFIVHLSVYAACTFFRILYDPAKKL